MSVTSESVSMSIEDILTALKSFETPELFKLLKTALTEAEKKSKTTAKTTKTATTTAKKQGSMPKGAVPPQLRKPRAWVEFTLKNALENGWESFTITQKKKSGGQDVSLEEIEMPASTFHEGSHIYEDSISDKTPNGKQIIHKEAMSLSKYRKESGHPTYAEFEAQYAEEVASEETSDDAKSTTSSKKSVVKKTAAEKAAEMEAKKTAKEQAKAEEKEQKKAEKEQAKAEEKERKKAEKDEAKAKEKELKTQAMAEKTEKKPVAKTVVPAKAVVVKKAEEESKPVVTKTVVTKPTPKKEEVIPDDGMVHPWTFEGKKYLRNADGETWSVGSDGGIGKWVGVYSSQTNKIDTSVSEPEFDDEE